MIQIYDLTTKKYIPFEFLIDTLSSATWVTSQTCRTNICYNHNKLMPLLHFGKYQLKMNNGEINGHIYLTHVNLENFNLSFQPVLLVDDINLVDFMVSIS